MESELSSDLPVQKKLTGWRPFGPAYLTLSMSDYDEHVPIFSGNGTDLMAELGRELTSPLFRQLPRASSPLPGIYGGLPSQLFRVRETLCPISKTQDQTAVLLAHLL